MAIIVRPREEGDLEFVLRVFKEFWNGPQVHSLDGTRYEAATVDGLVAEIKGEPQGLLTFSVRWPDFEIVTLNSLQEGLGMGRALLDAATTRTRAERCQRMLLYTMNDNTRALRFYQMYGFTLSGFFPENGLKCREQNPQMPEFGQDGIPLRDDFELEFRLD